MQRYAKDYGGAMGVEHLERLVGRFSVPSLLSWTTSAVWVIGLASFGMGQSVVLITVFLAASVSKAEWLSKSSLIFLVPGFRLKFEEVLQCRVEVTIIALSRRKKDEERTTWYIEYFGNDRILRTTHQLIEYDKRVIIKFPTTSRKEPKTQNQ